VLYRTEPLDDVLSFLVTMGSPAIGAYSLQITHLNTRWITTAFLDIKYPNSKYIPAVLSAFHHVPIRISQHPPLLHSLIVLPENGDFWRHLLAAVKKIRRWSIPLVINFILVIIAVILNILDSTYAPGPGDGGYGVAAIWAFLLPLVIGWLHVGCEPEPNHLRNSLDTANLNAWVATGQEGQPMRSPLAIEFMKAEDVDLARKDELKAAPVFNYSRAFTSPLAAELVLRLMKNAATNAERRIPVGNPMGRAPAWVEGEGNAISDENRIGTDTEVTRYCTRILPKFKSNSSFTTPLDIQSEITNAPNLLLPLHDFRLVTQSPSIWATGIWKRVAISAALALGLQWGTVGGAIIVHYLAIPVGLGCRSLSFLLYGMAGTTSFFLFLTSSVLAHMSRPHQERRYVRSRLRTCQNAGAIICRWLGQFVAVLSALEILLVCFFLTTGTFDSCFCRYATFDMGKDPVVLPVILDNIGGPGFGISIGGLAVGFSTALLFGLSIYLGTPPRR
jgi:hypothetical protein